MIAASAAGVFENYFIYHEGQNILFKLMACSVCAQNLSAEQADYCVRNMKPYVDPRTGRGVVDAYNYTDFVHTLFIS